MRKIAKVRESTKAHMKSHDSCGSKSRAPRAAASATRGFRRCCTAGGTPQAGMQAGPFFQFPMSHLSEAPGARSEVDTGEEEGVSDLRWTPERVNKCDTVQS